MFVKEHGILASNHENRTTVVFAVSPIKQLPSAKWDTEQTRPAPPHIIVHALVESSLLTTPNASKYVPCHVDPSLSLRRKFVPIDPLPSSCVDKALDQTTKEEAESKHGAAYSCYRRSHRILGFDSLGSW